MLEIYQVQMVRCKAPLGYHQSSYSFLLLPNHKPHRASIEIYSQLMKL